MGRPKETISVEEKFWSFVDKQKEDACWNWKGCFTGGYGYMYHHSLSRKNQATHRLSYIINNGIILNDLFVLHKCNNKKCVNPKHLYLGTHLDNMKDFVNSNLGKGVNSSHSKLTNEIVQKMRNIYFYKQMSLYGLADKFNVSYSTVQELITGKTWPHISGPIKGKDYV